MKPFLKKVFLSSLFYSTFMLLPVNQREISVGCTRIRYLNIQELQTSH